MVTAVTEALDAMSSSEFREWLSLTMRALRGGRTQANIATVLNVPLATYIKWEQRGSLPGEYYRQFAAIFNMTTDELMAYRPSPAAQRVRARGRPPRPLTPVRTSRR